MIPYHHLDELSDLEIIDRFIEKGMYPFIDPRLFRHICRRGLAHLVHDLPRSAKKARAIVRARLSREGKYTGDEEIERIASLVDRIGNLQKDLCAIRPTDAEAIRDQALTLVELSERLLDFYSS